MREKFARFMAGRYGSDQLNKLISVICLVLVILAMILNGTKAAGVLWIVGFALLMLVYFRMFSRNIYKRTAENNSYMRFRYNAGKRFRMIKERWTQRKDYKFLLLSGVPHHASCPQGQGQDKHCMP